MGGWDFYRLNLKGISLLKFKLLKWDQATVLLLLGKGEGVVRGWGINHRLIFKGTSLQKLTPMRPDNHFSFIGDGY